MEDEYVGKESTSWHRKLEHVVLVRLRCCYNRLHGIEILRPLEKILRRLKKGLDKGSMNLLAHVRRWRKMAEKG